MAVRTGSSIGTLCLWVQGQEEAVTAAVFQFSFRQQRHSSETSSADKLRYATEEIWEPEGCVYNNTITSQAWQLTCRHPLQITAGWLWIQHDSRQRRKQATFTHLGNPILNYFPFTICVTHLDVNHLDRPCFPTAVKSRRATMEASLLNRADVYTFHNACVCFIHEAFFRKIGRHNWRGDALMMTYPICVSTVVIQQTLHLKFSTMQQNSI